MKMYLTGIILFILLTVGVSFAAWWWLRPAEQRFISEAQVIQQMLELSRIETAQFTIETIIDGGSTGSVFRDLLFGDRILLIAHGEVIAGVDLSQISTESVRVDGESVKLELPPTMILVSSLDQEKTRVYDRRVGLLTKGDAALETTARQVAEQKILAAACEGGILQQAADNAQSQLTQLLAALGFEQIIVMVPAGEC